MHVLPPREKEVCLKGQSHKHLLEANGGLLNLMHVLPPTGKKEVCLKGQSDKHLLEANRGILSLMGNGKWEKEVCLKGKYHKQLLGTNECFPFENIRYPHGKKRPV
jgi:hypothetical protein